MKKVLIVDDAKNIRMLLTKCLELEGYQVKTATNGKDALALFSSERFDLAFLDIKLPELSGTEVLRRIRAQGNDTPVIVITAYPTVKNAVECTKLQSITYLQKPFTADRLRAVLKEVTPPDPLPASSDAYKCAADLLDAERWEEAISRLKAALAADPTDPAVYFGLERAYLDLGDRETAEKFHNAGRSFT